MGMGNYLLVFMDGLPSGISLYFGASHPDTIQHLLVSTERDQTKFR